MTTQPDLGFVHRFERGSTSLTLLLLHGTGGDEADLVPLGRHLAPGANLLSPRGKVLEHGLPRFFRRLAMGVFDEEDLKHRTHELGRFVADAAALYEFDRQAVVAVGYSNGANIAASLLLLEPSVVRAAALMHAMVPFQPEMLPDLARTSVLLTGGADDPMIPVAQTEALARLLGAAGAEVELRLFPGGHQVSAAEVELVRDWLTRVHDRIAPPARAD